MQSAHRFWHSPLHPMLPHSHHSAHCSMSGTPSDNPFLPDCMQSVPDSFHQQAYSAVSDMPAVSHSDISSALPHMLSEQPLPEPPVQLSHLLLFVLLPALPQPVHLYLPEKSLLLYLLCNLPAPPPAASKLRHFPVHSAASVQLLQIYSEYSACRAFHSLCSVLPSFLLVQDLSRQIRSALFLLLPFRLL